jgi:hypothetical protein
MDDAMDCKVFVMTDAAPAELARLLADSLAGALAGPPFAPVVRTAGIEVEIRANPDRNDAEARAEVDGFLYYPYALELYPARACQHADKLLAITTLLESLWRRGWPAVAACDYEAELPCAGGSDPSRKPWLEPVQGTNGQVHSGSGTVAGRSTQAAGQ